MPEQAMPEHIFLEVVGDAEQREGVSVERGREVAHDYL